MTKRERLVYELGLAALAYTVDQGCSVAHENYGKALNRIKEYDDRDMGYEGYTGPTACDLT